MEIYYILLDECDCITRFCYSLYVGGCDCLWKSRQINMSMPSTKSIWVRYPRWWVWTKQWNEKPMACNCLLLFRKLNHQFYCDANVELNARKCFRVHSFETNTRSNFAHSWERRLYFGVPRNISSFGNSNCEYIQPFFLVVFVFL